MSNTTLILYKQYATLTTKQSYSKYTRLKVKVISHKQARNYSLYGKNVPSIQVYEIKIRKQQKIEKQIKKKERI